MNRALVVTTPDVSAVRDTDRIIGVLESCSVSNIELIVNRVCMDKVRRGDMMAVEDVAEVLVTNLIGVIQEEARAVTTSIHQGKPVVLSKESLVGKAIDHIARRIQGEQVAFMPLESSTNLMGKLKRLLNL